MSSAELLANTLSADGETRANATSRLEQAATENYPNYMLTLAAELGNEQSPVHIRNAAGVALKNALTARDSQRQGVYSARWLALDLDTKGRVKQEVLRSLASASIKAGTFAAQVVASIASVELPVNQWPEAIEILLGFVNSPDNVNLRVSSLQAIGFICESIKPEILSLRSNEILTAVIHGARKDEPSPDVQTAAINALYNSLEFVRENFEREGERNYIMQVVCEATQNTAVSIQVAAFECLVRIMSLYYDKMSFYMERALFGLTVLGMNHPEDSVVLQAIEFWSTVCEEEYELSVEAAEAQQYGELPEHESKFFASIALPEIIPVLLKLLTRQDEDADEDEWNVSMASATCISLLSQAVGDNIVAPVIPFIEANVKSTDWHMREAAVMTFGSILDGPDPDVLRPLVTQALPILIDMLRDEHVMVKDTTAWTLGRICELVVSVIQPDVHLHPLVSSLVNSLNDEPRIVGNACWALNQLSENLSVVDENQSSPPSSPLSPYYEGIVTSLLQVTEKPTNESNFRTAAYEALTAYVSNSAYDTLQIVQQVLLTMLNRMEQLLGVTNQLLGIDDRANWNELQSNLCSVVTSVIRKLRQDIHPMSDKIMTLLLSLVTTSTKQTTVLEDAFLVVGAMATSLDHNFAPYVSAFLPFLYPALKAHDDSQLCSVAVGLIGDISRALGPQTVDYASAFMGVLSENLRSDVLNRNVKIPILACFGDIALSIGVQFQPYLDATMGVLRQAGSITPNPMDYELIDYVNSLREGILDAYIGVVQAFKNSEQVMLVLPHVPSMLHLIRLTVEDEEHTTSGVSSAFGLLGDLSDAFSAGQIKDQLLVDWVAVAFKNKSRVPSEARNALRYAREMVKRATGN